MHTRGKVRGRRWGCFRVRVRVFYRDVSFMNRDALDVKYAKRYWQADNLDGKAEGNTRSFPSNNGAYAAESSVSHAASHQIMVQMQLRRDMVMRAHRTTKGQWTKGGAHDRMMSVHRSTDGQCKSTCPGMEFCICTRKEERGGGTHSSSSSSWSPSSLMSSAKFGSCWIPLMAKLRMESKNGLAAAGDFKMKASKAYAANESEAMPLWQVGEQEEAVQRIVEHTGN
jgi:hypothetical protein